MARLRTGKASRLEPRQARQLLQWATRGYWHRGRWEMEAELARFGRTFKYEGGMFQ